MRTLAASAHGYSLRVSRYGRETKAVVREAHAREGWDRATWQAWQKSRLEDLLVHAARQVPHYRRHWESRPGADVRELAIWPILEKRTLRESPRDFLADGFEARGLIELHTSGTTGTPLTLWRTRATSVHWYALFEARARMWHDVSLASRWANLGGQIVIPTEAIRPPYWVWNAGLNQLYMSSYHLQRETVPAYLEALRKHRIEYLWGYSSSLYALAQGARDAGLEREAAALGMRLAMTNAEPLYPYQRTTIHEVFGCPVRETYGMAEIVAAACECPSGSLHEWPDVGVVELLDQGRPVADGETGDLVATGLLSREMPLVRYRVGDRAARLAGALPCACGRRLPRWSGVEGRIDDVLVTRDGRRVGRLDPIFKGDLPIHEAQIVQESLDRIVVRYVPAPAFEPAHGASIVKGVRERLGDVEVTLEPVAAIPRSANGKFRAVISRVNSATAAVADASPR